MNVVSDHSHVGNMRYFTVVEFRYADVGELFLSFWVKWVSLEFFRDFQNETTIGPQNA